MRQFAIMLIVVLCLVLNVVGYGGRSNLSAQTTLTFTSPSMLPSATVGQQYRTLLTAAGGSPPYSFAVFGTINNALPGGLSIDGNGNLSGTPICSAQYQTELVVTDQAKQTATMVVGLDVLTPAGAQGVRRLTMSSSSPKNYIGQDANYFYGDSDGAWSGYAQLNANGQPDTLNIAFSSYSDSNVIWTVQFSTSELVGVPLTPRNYKHAQAIGNLVPGQVGMEVSTAFRLCTTLEGSFKITDATFDLAEPVGGQAPVVAFAATFSQMCPQDKSPLTGTILFGVPGPPAGGQTPSVTSATYNSKKDTLTVQGKRFNSKCTLLIDGHQTSPTKVGASIVAVGLTLASGPHEIQVADVAGGLSNPFLFTVK
jgi:hypothetical protein